ncbi:MAG: hypothetical protein QXW79_01195 [Thermoplasmata archaeon]
MKDIHVMDRNTRPKLMEKIDLNPNIVPGYKISYINVDSSKRNKESINIYDDKIYNLPPYPLYFTNSSSLIMINFPNHPFEVNDRIVLGNVTSKNLLLQNIISIKKNSEYARINHRNHGLSLYGFYNPNNPNEFTHVSYVEDLPHNFRKDEDLPDSFGGYYVLNINHKFDLTIQLANIKILDQYLPESEGAMIGNIPINFLNSRHTVYLLFVKMGNIFQVDPNCYLIKLIRKSSINYRDGANCLEISSSKMINNMVHIKFNNLYGIPLKYLNFGTPTSENAVNPYATIVSKSKDHFIIDVGYKAIVDPSTSFYDRIDINDFEDDPVKLVGSNRGGGTSVFVRKIRETLEGYPNPNFYSYPLERVYTNVKQARIVSSIFPKSPRNVVHVDDGTSNNRLYWRNLDDGDHIYHLEIIPGNYQLAELAEAIEEAFSRTIRRKYLNSYCDQSMYDGEGYYKYHIVKVSISENTDTVSLSTFREIVQENKDDFQILVVPDIFVEFTMKQDLRTNLGKGGLDVLPFIFSPFNVKNDVLFIYFTKNTHIHVPGKFPFMYGNLYRYVHHTTMDVGTENTFLVEMEVRRALLVNFYREKEVYPRTVSVQEIVSINTNIILTNFEYNYLTREVHKINHSLHVGDLIITDQFHDPFQPNLIFVYEVTNIIDSDHFIVTKIPHGTKYKFIYDGLILNFGIDSDFFSYWLDQVEPQKSENSFPTNSTLSITNISPRPEGKKIMWVRHPDHHLNVGDQVTISFKNSVNYVPANVISKTYKINRILDKNRYEVLLDPYFPLASNFVENSGNVIIRYPDFFQLLFNYTDTIGQLLGFRDVGRSTSVTPYKHMIKNTDPYIGFDLDSGYIPNKLDLKGFRYFYITSPELGHFNNTQPVQNVFAIIKWIDEYNGYVFDTMVPSIKIFNPPLEKLERLNFGLFYPNGRLVEFNGLDHQFVIEILELQNEIHT